MKEAWRTLARRKLLVAIVATWLVSLGYVVYQQAMPRGRHHQPTDVQEQPKELLLPAASRRPVSYALPAWPKVDEASRRAAGGELVDRDMHIQILTSADSRRGDYFDAHINATEMMIVAELMKQVDAFCREHNLIYFMYAATLVGSHRHHGLVPWDDDLDIMIPMSQRNRFIHLLRTRAPHLRMFTWSYHWKIWAPALSVTIVHNNYGWPFLDLFFYGENETHIYDTDVYYTATYCYEKNIVFPLHYRPFMGQWLPAPRDTAQFLVRTLKDPDGCHSPYYNHRIERPPKRTLSTRCEMLKERFPFVMRSQAPNGEGIIETFAMGDTPLHSVLVREPNISITFNYSLRLIYSDGVKYAEPYS